MGKATMIILFTLISFLSFSQCDKEYIVLNEDSTCTTVEMSKERFAHYYLVDKNLSIIQDTIPELFKSIDLLKVYNDSLSTLSIQIKLEAAKQDSVYQLSLDHCMETAIEVDIENLYLAESNNKLKKKNKVWKGVSLILSILTLSLILSK